MPEIGLPSVERGQRDLHGIGRRQLGAGAVELGHEALAVGEDDDVIIVREQARHRGGDRLRSTDRWPRRRVCCTRPSKTELELSVVCVER